MVRGWKVRCKQMTCDSHLLPAVSQYIYARDKLLSATRDSAEVVKVRCFIAEQAQSTQQLRRPKGWQGVSGQVTQSVFAMFQQVL